MATTYSSTIWCILLFGMTSTWPRYVLMQREDDVRLINGGQSSRGRVEVYDGEGWTTVCDDYWDNVDAMVVCRQLGYETEGAIARYSAYYGMGTGYISLDNVKCYGHEKKLISCPSSSAPNNCKHTEDAGVECVPKEGDVRLMDGSLRTEGRVEIFHDGEWGTICDSGWDDDDAAVVCRQVGFPSDYATAVFDANFGRGQGRIALENVRCSGTESSLSSCLSSSWYPRFCLHFDDAGVICGQTESPSTPVSSILIGFLSFAGLIMLIVVLVIIIRLKRGNKLSCSLIRRLAEYLRNPLYFDDNTENTVIPVEGSNHSNLTPSDPPPGYPLTVQLNDNNQDSLYSPNEETSIHVTNISLNVNFENQQILLIPPNGQISSPPPYSPSTTDSRNASSGMLISPPPYSASSIDNQHPSIQDAHQNDSIIPREIEHSNSQRTRPISDLQSLSNEEIGIITQPLYSSENIACPPPYTCINLMDNSSHNPPSFNDESTDESDGDFDNTLDAHDIAQYNLPRSSPHRDSMILSDVQTTPISSRSSEQPPPYSPWSMSTFV